MLKVPSSIEKIKYITARNNYKLYRKKKKKKIKFFLKKNFKLKYKLSSKKYFISTLKLYFIRYLAKKEKSTRKKKLLPRKLNKKLSKLKASLKKFKKPKQ